MSCGDGDYRVCKKCGAPVRKDPVTGKKEYQPPPIYIYPMYPPPCPQLYYEWWGIYTPIPCPPYIVTHESSTYTGRAEDVASVE